MNVELRDIAKSLQNMDRQMADIIKLQKLIVKQLNLQKLIVKQLKETNSDGKEKDKEVSEETE